MFVDRSNTHIFLSYSFLSKCVLNPKAKGPPKRAFQELVSSVFCFDSSFKVLIFSVLLIANFFIFCANFFHACFRLRSFATSALLTIKFLPNHEGIIKPRSDQWCQWRSAVSRFWVLLRVSLCPLWFKRLLSALISENQRQKGFDFLRVSVPPR